MQGTRDHYIIYVSIDRYSALAVGMEDVREFAVPAVVAGRIDHMRRHRRPVERRKRVIQAVARVTPSIGGICNRGVVRCRGGRRNIRRT